MPAPASSAERPSVTERVARLDPVVLPVLLAALTIYLGFDSGGYFAGTQGWTTAVLLLIVALRVVFLGRPPTGLTAPALGAGLALAGFALWTLASGTWSHAPYRALIEFDRVLLYGSVLALFATARRPELTLVAIPVALAGAVAVLCGAGVFVRTMPDVWPFHLPTAGPRMDWPISYENGLGLLAALGIIFSLHVASWRGRGRLVRVLAAAGMPLLAAALLLTFSRGGIAVAVAGVVVYALLDRSRGLVIAVAACVVPVAVAAMAAYGAELLAGKHSRSAAAIAQGHDLALTIVAACAGAAALMLALMPLEARLPRLQPTPRVKRATRIVAVVAVLGTAFAVVATGTASRLVDGSQGSATRDRLTDVRSQTRPDYWRVSLSDFRASPIHGRGAETFGLSWDRERPRVEEATEGHSLWIETLGELGLVGVLLLAGAIGTLAFAVVTRVRGRLRPLYGCIAAAGLAWLIHSAIDWDWELTALSAWVFAAGGCAAATAVRTVGARRLARPLGRFAIFAGCVLIALTPVAIARSQDQIDTAVSALSAGDCRTAVSAAQSAIDAMPQRPEPYAVIGWCDDLLQRPDLAIGWMSLAVQRDPSNWSYVYSRAVVRGAAGRDPRVDIRRALALNPLEDLTVVGARRLGGSSVRSWKRGAALSPVPQL